MAGPRAELAWVPGCAVHHAICRWRDRAFGASPSVGDQDLLEHLFVSGLLDLVGGHAQARVAGEAGAGMW
ncbi:hypothetical protein DBR42_14790 [Pelomonas sp. HMWF004]|nr:hypothetical protein DBR42_14790 [Pelomonas sp. HMWF004]